MTISFGQINEGTYLGIRNDSKIVAFIKNENGLILGYFYESRKMHHTLTGITTGNEVKGTMNFADLDKFACEGIFKGDSAFFFLNSDEKEHIITIALKKINNQSKINLNKYFGIGKQENDKKLVGEWFLFSEYDLNTKKFVKDRDYTSIVLKQNGEYRINGFNGGDISDVLISWYSQDTTLYVNFKSSHSNREVNQGKYTISGDTLITTRGHVMKYLRKK